MNAANVLQQQDRYQYAISVLKAATKVARTPEETATLQTRIEQLEGYQPMHADAPKANPQIAETAQAPPKHPAEPATGPKHTVTGVIRGVQCIDPALIEFKVEAEGKTVDVYSNNYYDIAFSSANAAPAGELHPCTDLEGVTAVVKYAEVSDKTVDGQISSVELRR